ncbi:MAG: tetratricopeptide repeat protein [Polyangiaceae bacterium]
MSPRVLSCLFVCALLGLACNNSPPRNAGDDPPPEALLNQGASGGSSGDSKSAEVEKAEAAIEKGDFAGAKKLASDAIAKDPKNGLAHYYLGVAEENLKQPDEAKKHYSDALKFSPRLSGAAVNLAGLLIGDKKFDEAAAVLKSITAKVKDDPQLFQNLAVALANLEDHAGAGEAFLSAISLGVNDPLVRLDCAEQLLLAKKEQLAAKVLKDGMSSVPAEVQADYSLLLMKAGAFQECVTVATKLVDAKGSSEALLLRGRCRRSAGDNDAARADLEASIKKKDGLPEPYVYLGDVLEKLKKPADAKKAYEKAISLKAAASKDDGPKLLKFAEKRLAELK